MIIEAKRTVPSTTNFCCPTHNKNTFAFDGTYACILRSRLMFRIAEDSFSKQLTWRSSRCNCAWKSSASDYETASFLAIRNRAPQGQNFANKRENHVLVIAKKTLHNRAFTNKQLQWKFDFPKKSIKLRFRKTLHAFLLTVILRAWLIASCNRCAAGSQRINYWSF